MACRCGRAREVDDCQNQDNGTASLDRERKREREEKSTVKKSMMLLIWCVVILIYIPDLVYSCAQACS